MDPEFRMQITPQQETLINKIESDDESCPIKSLATRLEIELAGGTNSVFDIAISVFTNRIVFVVSQLNGAIGNWVMAKSAEVINFGDNDEGVVSTRVIFGAEESWLHIMARRITIALGSSKPVLCSFTLQRQVTSDQTLMVENINRISAKLVELIVALKREQPLAFLSELTIGGAAN